MNTINILAPKVDFRYGSCVYKTMRNGWVFVPNVPDRRGSRRVYPTAEAAIPRWAKPYRIQEVLIVGTREAVEFPITRHPGQSL